MVIDYRCALRKVAQERIMNETKIVETMTRTAIAAGATNQHTGLKRSMAIILPKTWVTAHHIAKGDDMLVSILSDGTISITPPRRDEP